jgi:hypothetical protein
MQMKKQTSIINFVLFFTIFALIFFSFFFTASILFRFVSRVQAADQIRRRFQPFDEFRAAPVHRRRSAAFWNLRQRRSVHCGR